MKVTRRRTLLDDYRSYIHQRFTQGCRNTGQLHREIRDQGFPGDRSVDTALGTRSRVRAQLDREATPPRR